MSVSFETYEDIMKQWDTWRSYIANGGKGSWPRDAFEALLEYLEQEKQKAVNEAYEEAYDIGFQKGQEDEGGYFQHFAILPSI